MIRSTSVDTLSVDTLEDDGDEVDGNVVIYIQVKCRNIEQGKPVSYTHLTLPTKA